MSASNNIEYSHTSPAILTRWHVRVGDNVEEGGLIAEAEGQDDHACVLTLI